jgi:hypothetical protein
VVHLSESLVEDGLAGYEPTPVSYDDIIVGAGVAVRQIMEVVYDEDGQLYDASADQQINLRLRRTIYCLPRIIKGEVLAIHDDANDGHVIQIRPSDERLPDALVPASKNNHWIGTRLPDDHPESAAAGRVGHFAASYEFYPKSNAEQSVQPRQAA